MVVDRGLKAWEKNYNVSMSFYYKKKKHKLHVRFKGLTIVL